jgi:ABC-type Zn uptake system ZnuABC Zn-binding protein ZnuA
MVLQSISFFKDRPMTKRFARSALVVVAAAVLASGMPGCSRSTPAWQNRGGPPRVVVTIPALDSFVRNVGGKRVGVICLCTTKGPHHYEYNPTDAMLLRDADLFLAIGLTLDDKFADQMQDESHNARLRYVKLGERLPKKLLLKGEGHEEGKDEKGHEHEHGEYDPHVWLGIPQAIALVELICHELKIVDAGHAKEYEDNAAAYIEKLKKLHADGKAKLKDNKDRKIIAFHESLAYLADSFGLEIVDAIERAPGEEPLPGHLAKLVEKCKTSHVRILAVEPQYPQGSSADILKKEVKDIKLVEVDPLETADAADLREDQKELKSADWYETKMRQNVATLAKSLP